MALTGCRPTVAVVTVLWSDNVLGGVVVVVVCRCPGQRSTDPEAQRFSSLAIGNMASTEENRIPMVEEAALAPLVTYLRNPEADIIARQYCAMAVGNLASEKENHDEVWHGRLTCVCV